MLIFQRLLIRDGRGAYNQPDGPLRSKQVINNNNWMVANCKTNLSIWKRTYVCTTLLFK